jgi:TonB family protein
MYNHRLLSNPGLKGKITVKFAIDEFGNVLHCEVVESSIKDAELEQKVVAKIRAWRFDKIDKPGDVTEIVYPFVFAAG